MGKWKKITKHKPTLVPPSQELRSKHDANTTKLREWDQHTAAMLDTLAEVHDMRTWMFTHKSWEDYGGDVLKCTKRYLKTLLDAQKTRYELADAAEKARVNLVNSGVQSTLPLPILTSPAQLSELSKSKFDELVPVVQKAAELAEAEGKSEPSARHIKEAREAVRVERQKAKSEKEATAAPIPSNITKAIEAGRMVRDFIKTIRAACNRLDDFAASPYAVHLSPGQHTDTIRRVLEHFKLAVPYADCVYCGGHAECKKCDSRGWVRKVDFDAVPAGLRSNSRIVDAANAEDDGEAVEI